MADLLEERYRQLETNFKAIVAELKGRPSSPRQSAELEALLSRLDADLRHALLRGQAANLAAHQRLEERTAILQRNFARIVDLLNEPPSPQMPQSPAPPGGAALNSATPTGGNNGAGADASNKRSSPLAQTAHPWSGGACSAPPGGASSATKPGLARPSPPSPGSSSSSIAATPPGYMHRYDSIHASGSFSGVVSTPGSGNGGAVSGGGVSPMPPPRPRPPPPPLQPLQ